MLSHGFCEASTTSFLFAFDKKDQVTLESPSTEQFGRSAGDGEDGTFVVRSTTSVDISVFASQCEGVRRPPFVRGGNHIIMPAH